MFNFKLICVVIFLFNLHQIRSKISDKRLCANENCTKPISLAKTLIHYPSPENDILSFEKNADVTVYSKSAGSNMDLWGVEIDGKRGYAPKRHLRETKVFTKNISFLLNSELSDQQVPSIKPNDIRETIKANKVPAYDVVDGTTIYLNSEDEIIPTPSENNILPTSINQNIEENHIVNTNNAGTNIEETQPLELKLEESIKKEDNKLEVIENLQNNDYEHDEKSENKLINDISKHNEKIGGYKNNGKSENELMNGISKDSEKIVNNNKDNDQKESIMENVMQIVTDWMGKEKKESDEDYAVVDDESEDEEEEEEEDEEEEEEEGDYQDDEEDNSEEVDASEKNVSISKTSENNDQISDIEQESDIVNRLTGDAVEEYHDNHLSTLHKQESVEEDKKISKKNINGENTVKTRQLLSEKEIVDKSVSKTSQNEDDIQEIIDLQQNSEVNSMENKEILDNQNLNEKDNSGNPNNLPSNDNVHVDVIETPFTETPGLEIPLPFEDDIYVTPDPIKNVYSVTENPFLNEEGAGNSVMNDRSKDDNLNSLEKQEEISTPFPDESKHMGSEEIINENVVEKVDKSENIENLPSIDSLSEVTGTPFQIEVNDAHYEEESAKSNDHTINTNPESVDETKTYEKNVEPTNVTNVEEIIKIKQPDSGSTEDEFQTTPEIQQEEAASLKTSVDTIQDVSLEKDQDVSLNENQENTSGILSGFSNWFGSVQNNNINETVNEDNLVPSNIEESLSDNPNQDNELQKINDIDTSEKQYHDITKDKITENENQYKEISNSDNIEAIEKHDHDFLSMIKEHHEIISTDELKSSQTQENLVQDEVSEVPVSEIVSEEAAEKELIEETFNSEDILENHEMPTEELNRDEHSQTQDNLHIFDVHDHLLSKNSVDYGSCAAGESDCSDDIEVIQKQLEMEQVSSNYNYSDYLNLLTLLGATGLSVAIFLLGFISIDKNRKEGTLIAKINTLEKALLVSSKENALLIDRVAEIQNETAIENDRISSEEYEQLNKTFQETIMAKSLLEDQIQSLEKELENSTEVGLELNRMLSDILSSQNGSETLIANVEQLQRQLVEQQSTTNTINDTLNLKDTENHELQLELEIKNKKVTHLQAELDKMAMNLFKVEEDKEQMQGKLESEILELKDQLEKNKNAYNSTRTKLLDEINSLKTKFSEIQRSFEVKTNEYTILKENFNQIKTIKNNTEALESLLNASSMKAELQQLQRDNQALNDLLRQEQQTKYTLEKQVEIALQEAQSYKAKYDESDKEKLEALTKLEVLSNYFKEREAQLQKELSKQESMWIEHQGQATSTIERIQYMQEELQNCKSQNELLKQEIVSQEVELKSQISVLEKKAHESWLIARQAERRLEDAKQEAAQLRNRLTLKERSFTEDKGQNRIQSSLEQNGDIAVSPLHMPVESPASPPLLYGTRDHLTTSPPLPNLPPFLPPPPGVPFMPPPISGVPGFMPPPPSMFPVDHRPPPLGRMSSPPPPLNSRYSPDSRYSPYDRNSPSPPYDDEYGSSPPPMHRGYSPYNNRDDRRDYKRLPPPPPHRPNGRNKGAMSSGSGNSNESLEKINRHHSKV